MSVVTGSKRSRQVIAEYTPAGKGQKRGAHMAQLEAVVRQAKRARVAQQQETIGEIRESIRRLDALIRRHKRKRKISALQSEAKRLEDQRRSKQVRERPMSKVELAASQRLLELKQGALGDSQERERERNAKRRKKAAAPTAEAQTKQVAKARVRAGKGKSVRAIGRRLALK
jgi:hypothetical protein